MVDRKTVLGLPKGTTVSFKYRFPGNGPYVRVGIIDTVEDLGERNMVNGNKLRFYGTHPVRPKGRVLVTMLDKSVGDYRSFYTEYMDNLVIT